MENATGKPLKDYRPIEQRMWHFMEEEIGKKNNERTSYKRTF